MKIVLILALALLAALSSLALAVEYKTLDTEYFKVEYPADWNVDEQKENTLFYYFVIPYKDKAGDEWSNYINVGLKGVQIRLIIDPQLKGMFNEDGP
jgi:hypothetical protein